MKKQRLERELINIESACFYAFNPKTFYGIVKGHPPGIKLSIKWLSQHDLLIEITLIPNA